MKTSTLVTAACIVGFAVQARAGYDRTDWGMTLAQVRKLYPQGATRSTPVNVGETRTIYVVERSIAGHAAIVNFMFDADHGLNEVVITFPKPGTAVDVGAGRYTMPTRKEAARLRGELAKSLVLKYGLPAPVNIENGAAWVTKTGECIKLESNELPDDDGPVVVLLLTYSNCVQQRTEGL